MPGGALQAGPEQLARLSPQLAQHPRVKGGQKMDGALDSQKVAITHGVLQHRNWFI